MGIRLAVLGGLIFQVGSHDRKVGDSLFGLLVKGAPLVLDRVDGSLSSCSQVRFPRVRRGPLEGL